jgi:Glycosyl transferase family 2
MSSLALAVMAKNESIALPRLLASVEGLVDSVILMDTGSADDTAGIALGWCREHGIPFFCVEKEFENFGVNRSALLEAATGLEADFLLLMDADMTVNWEGFDKDTLNQHDAWSLRYTGDLDYSQVLLVRNRKGFHYVGATHEYITTREPFTEGNCSITVAHHADGYNRADKYTRDLKLLRASLREEPDNVRTMFYLARTEECLGEIELAVKHFELRSQMGGWEEEAWYAEFSAARLAPTFEGLFKAYERRPSRIEPLIELAAWLRQNERYAAAYMVANHALRVMRYPEGDKLFIDRSCYEWRIPYELSISSFYAGSIPEARDWNKHLLALDLPGYIRAQVVKNREFTG